MICLKTPNYLADISATKFCSEAVLYSKQTAEYHLSPQPSKLRLFLLKKGDDKFQFKNSFEILKSPAIFEKLVQIFLCDLVTSNIGKEITPSLMIFELQEIGSLLILLAP